MKIFSPKLIGRFAHILSQCLIKTLRIRIVLHPDTQKDKQYAYGFWHDKQFAPVLLVCKIFNIKSVGLVSASRDGDMLSSWLTCLGYHVVRGSSSRKAISSLVKLLAAVKSGYSIGIAADGPRGPRYEAKPGISYIACKAGVPVVPIGVAYSAKWIFKKSWDKYQLPIPFSKLVLYVGQPLAISDISDLEAVNNKIAMAICFTDEKAQSILNETAS